MNFRGSQNRSTTPIDKSAALEVGAFTLPALSHYEAAEARHKLLLTLDDLFENWDLLPTSNEFSSEWFDAAERMYRSVLLAQQIGHSRTGKPVKREAAESQKRIARAILERVELAKAAIASATPVKIIKPMVGQVIWVGSNGRGGRGIRETQHKQKRGSKPATFSFDVDFAVSIRAAINCLGIWSIRDGSTLIYEVSVTDDLQSILGRAITLNGGGMVTFYDGNENQQPPTAIEALAGVGNTPAYRGQFLALFTNFPRAGSSDSIPQLTFEFLLQNGGDRSVANQLGAEILHLMARFRSEPDRIRGQKNARAASEGGRAKGYSNQAERLDWQREAERIRLKRPNLSDRSIARDIAAARRLDKSKIETIRKVIKRPKARR